MVFHRHSGFAFRRNASCQSSSQKNPISSENLCGLARVVRSNSMTAMENIPLWHERDISHSSAERIIFPDSTILIDYMLNRLSKTIENLVVHKENMLKNTNLFGGIVFSQKVLLQLCDKGLSRERAYELVQRNALDAFNNNGSFIDNLLKDNDVLQCLSKDDIQSCFNIEDYLKNIDFIYNNFGI